MTRRRANLRDLFGVELVRETQVAKVSTDGGKTYTLQNFTFDRSPNGRVSNIQITTGPGSSERAFKRWKDD